MLLGADIHVYTYHKNLTFNEDIKTQRVLRWCAKLNEFLPFIHYIEGERNILAGQLSRLERLPTPAQLAEGKKLVEPAELLMKTDSSDDEAYFLEKEFSCLYDETSWNVIKCYLNLPEAEHPEKKPLSYAYIRERRQEDDALLALLNKYPDN